MRTSVQRETTPREKAEVRFHQRLAKQKVPTDIAANPDKLAAYKAGYVSSYGDGLVDGVRIGLDLRSQAEGFTAQMAEDEFPA